MTRLLTSIFAIVISLGAVSQVSITAANGTYTQDFGTTDITTWTDNSTFLGWYMEAQDETPIKWGGHLTVDGVGTLTNTGGYYSYECTADPNDQKIGSRPSGGTDDIYIGVRFVNNSGQTIESIEVLYTGYQLSLAQSGGNLNSLYFGYRISATPITDLQTGAYTNVAALDFDALQTSGACCSAQLSEFNCSESTTISSCIDLSIPDGHEIMLRWEDVNDPANDHHLTIDDVTVLFAEDNACTLILPVELISFDVSKSDDNTNILDWITASEQNNAKFEIERSSDGFSFTKIGEVDGSGNSSVAQLYSYVDNSPENGYNYYRLKQIDFDNNFSYSEIKRIVNKSTNFNAVYSQNCDNIIVHLDSDEDDFDILLTDITGKLISTTNSRNKSSVMIPCDNLSSGIYLINLKGAYSQTSQKISINN